MIDLSYFRAPRRTYWVEHSDGSGHWASNWEIAESTGTAISQDPS